MAVVTSFTEDQNFWEGNPQLLLDPIFKELYTKDKTKGKDESSRTMWWVAFCYDMDSDNKWRGAPLDEKQAILGEEFLGNRNFYSDNKKKLDGIIERYIQFTDSEAKAALRDWEAKIKERREFLRETKYTMGEIGERGNWVGGTATALDNMLANTKSLFDDYNRIKKSLSDEATEGQGKGGSTSSLSDSGEI